MSQMLTFQTTALKTVERARDPDAEVELHNKDLLVMTCKHQK